MTDALSPGDFASLRGGLAALARADNHAPGANVDATLIVTVPGHRAALDPERSLVVGNRGMGKSLWAHALADATARGKIAATFRELSAIDVRIGFNASERIDMVAPTPSAVQEAFRTRGDAEAIWRAVLARVAAQYGIADANAPSPENFGDLVGWVQLNGERVERLLTALDDHFVGNRQRLVLVFDALDRLGSDWQTTRALTLALLKRTLAVLSYRAIRLKLFMRRDQFEDQILFEFPDGSKIRNTRVDLTWSNSDLYGLLFARLQQSPISGEAFKNLALVMQSQYNLSFDGAVDQNNALIDVIAGKYMGADKKRGRVYTWLPLHLSDARGELSPRTFLTAWREAAHHMPAPPDRAVDHSGLLEGVRKASEDRLQELQEDYWWIRTALAPLRGQMVPMERALLEKLWRESNTVTTIRERSSTIGLAPVQLVNAGSAPEASLVSALAAIGIIEIRSNGKINVPDIFRVEAGIKRKGGVRPPKRVPTDER